MRKALQSLLNSARPSQIRFAIFRALQWPKFIRRSGLFWELRAGLQQAGLLKTKNRFYSKGSEQCIKRGFFPPGYAELEPSASYLASSSARQRFFFFS
jgi:hypothetical protein